MSARARRIAPAALLVALLGALLGAPATSARAADLPDWLAEASARTTPAWSTAAAVVLHDEQRVILERPGRVVITTRRAMRVEAHEATNVPALGIAFNATTSDIERVHVWTLAPGAKPVRLGRTELAEHSMDSEGSLYSEVHLLLFDPPALAHGTIVAWESVVESESLLDQWSWSCSENRPVLLSRFALTLPEGSTPSVVELGPKPFVAAQDGRTWSWSHGDAGWSAPEPLATENARVRAAIAVNVTGAAAGPRFADWTAVAQWLDGLMAPQLAPTPDVSAHARGLLPSATDSLARIRALGRDVQRLNYLSISLGLERGGGYRPHPAGQVLAMGYGDCKDKAALLVALLASAGHEAWPVVVSSEGRSHVDERWPSPMQFDHCIVALRAPVGSDLPTTFDHPQLGRLIAFDPTDPYTAFGDLPAAEQGSLALLVDAEHGALIRLPVVAHDHDRTVRTVHASLDSTGGLAVALDEQATGQAARTERGAHRELGAAAYRTRLEKWLVGAGRRIEIDSLTVVDDSSTGAFRFRLRYRAPYYARVVQGRILMFRAAIVTPRVAYDLPATPRTGEVELDAGSLVESVTVELPPGFAVDEIPANLQVAEEFGSFDATWEVKGSTLEFNRRWRLDGTTLPPERYPDVRALYAAMFAAIESPVVLVRP